MTEHSKIADEFQKVGKDGFDAAVRSYGDANKGFQAIVAEATNYSKTTFEEGTRAFQQLLSAKSVEQAVEIQSQYVKKAYEAHISQMTKLGEMYVSLAQNAFKPLAR
jgi:phasin family protein